MSRLRKIAQIPGRELGQVGGPGLLGAHARHLVPAVSKAKVTAAGTPRCRRSCSKASRSRPCGRTARLGSAGRLRGDRDQRQSRQHTLVGRQCARQDRRDLNAR